MKIFVIGYGHSMCDKRVKRTVKALSKFSDVFYQYLDRKDDNQSCEDELRNVKLLPIKYPGKSRNVFHWVMKWRNFDKKLWNMLQEAKVDCVYFHQIPFTLEKFFIKTKKQKLRIIYDAHEIFPDQNLSGRKIPFEKFYRKILWRKYGRIIELSDRLIFVSEEAAKYVFEKLRIKKEFIVIPNVADFRTAEFQKYEHREKSIVIVGGSKRIVPDEYISAIVKSGFKVKIIGNMVLENEEQYEIMRLPFLPYESMMKEISAALFSLNVYFPPQGDFQKFYSNYVFSLPNKFYDSLAVGTPILVHRYFQSMAKIVEREGVGIVFNTPEELEHYLSTITKDKYNKMIENIERNVEDYCWTEEWEKKFLDYII